FALLAHATYTAGPAMCLARQEHGGRWCSGRLCQRETPRAGERYAADARGGVRGSAAVGDAGRECARRPSVVRATSDASPRTHAARGLAAGGGGGWGAGEEGGSVSRAGTPVVCAWHTRAETARPRRRAAGF